MEEERIKSAALLAELQAVHAQLLSAISDLEALVACPTPDGSKLAALRMKLSRASGQRLKFLEYTAYPFILGAGSAADIQIVSRLREGAAALRASSTEHVGQWSLQEIVADWNGYRRASAAMTASMRKRIATEKEAIETCLAKKP